jgi:hypothetical protein
MRRWCLVAGGVGLVIVVLAAMGAGLVLRGGISARAEPSLRVASLLIERLPVRRGRPGAASARPSRR